MTGRIAALFRYPIKGFAPERRNTAKLSVGEGLPGDRLFAVEDGPSGFDPAAPKFISKQRFTVAAKLADVVRAKTMLSEEGRLTARADGRAAYAGDIASQVDRDAFCDWVEGLLGGETSGPLRLLEGPGHRFFDHPLGHISLLNLASVRDLEAKLGVPVDPARFRANLYVEGWPAWEELAWSGRALALGAVEATVFKPIVRCAATQVNPATAQRDIDMTAELFRLYGHMHMGLYVQVTRAGHVAEGDPAGLLGP